MVSKSPGIYASRFPEFGDDSFPPARILAVAHHGQTTPIRSPPQSKALNPDLGHAREPNHDHGTALPAARPCVVVAQVDHRTI